MSKTQAVVTISKPASGDLSASQFLFGVLNGSGQVALVSTQGARVDGVIANKPTAAAQPCELQVDGLVKAIAGGVIAPGGEVMSSSAGKAIAATTGNYVFGIYAGAANSANNDMIEILVDKYVSLGGAGLIDSSDLATVANGGVSPASLTGGVMGILVIDIPDAGTTTYDYVNAEKIEIIDVWNIKDVAGAGNTIQVKDSASAAITDAMVAAVDKTLTRAATIDKAKRVLAAAAGFKVTASRSAGSMAAQLFVAYIKRA